MMSAKWNLRQSAKISCPRKLPVPQAVPLKNVNRKNKVAVRGSNNRNAVAKGHNH